MIPATDWSAAFGEGDFQDRMKDYIRRHFGHLLGADVELLDRPNGLEMIQAKYGLGGRPARPANEEIRQAA
jgi:hypothetical protein